MALPTVQVSVYITNQVTRKILIVHCRSKDDDLGAHAVAVGSSIHWSFGPNIFGARTVFWCKLAVQDKRISFVAYEQERVTYGDWVVRDDGVYARPYGHPMFLHAPWTQP
ncbi:unnamed protein product [Linum tenue]|uniref:S-protein homolog n=1 Tax=Linum tenue TaxID=586396 RepID=A0AAV0IBJ7_9ROSI|nr:unnamed protein product [Linum tenue]